MEIRACLGVFWALLIALLHLLEVLVDVLPFLLASLGTSVVTPSLHSSRDLFP